MYLLTFLMLLTVGTAYSQCMDSLWRQEFSTPQLDWIQSLIASGDGNVVSVGYTDYSVNPWTARGHVRKMNPSTGEEIWARDFVNLGAQDVLLDIAHTTDGGFISTGISRTPGSLARNCWLLKMSVDGDSLWSRTYGDGYDVAGECVVPTLGGGFGIAGSVMQLVDGETFDWRLIKTNHLGDSLWSVVIGNAHNEEVTDLITNSTGDFVIMGYRVTVTEGSTQGRLAAVSQSGQVLWEQTYSITNLTRLYSGFGLPGGGYWVCGITLAPDSGTQSFVMELDEDGELLQLWEYNLMPNRFEEAFGMIPDGQGGAYLYGAGYRNSPEEADVFVAHVSECGGLISVDWVGDGASESVRSGALLGSGHMVLGGTIRLDPDQWVWDMLFYGLDTNICNIPPCSFERIWPLDSTVLDMEDPTYLIWNSSHDPEGSTITYLIDIESSFPIAYDNEVTDTLIWFQLLTPVLPLDELFEFRWTVRATDGQDTVEAANGQGYFQIDIPVDADDPILHPASFTLSAFPNPFNPTTTLSFTLTQASHVQLDLFDIQGRLVRTMVNNIMTAGSHAVTFDGSGLASGIYFANLRANNRTRLAKLVLMK